MTYHGLYIRKIISSSRARKPKAHCADMLVIAGNFCESAGFIGALRFATASLRSRARRLAMAGCAPRRWRLAFPPYTWIISVAWGAKAEGALRRYAGYRWQFLRKRRVFPRLEMAGCAPARGGSLSLPTPGRKSRRRVAPMSNNFLYSAGRDAILI